MKTSGKHFTISLWRPSGLLEKGTLAIADTATLDIHITYLPWTLGGYGKKSASVCENCSWFPSILSVWSTVICSPVSNGRVWHCYIDMTTPANMWIHVLCQKNKQANKLNFFPCSLLTGGHCASLSAATSWTFKCLLCDFPLDFINRCKT